MAMDFRESIALPCYFCGLYSDAIRMYARGNLVVKALGYKPEDRGFETRWCEILNLPNSSSRSRPWGLLSL
jgi:hypothetical protein